MIVVNQTSNTSQGVPTTESHFSQGFEGFWRLEPTSDEILKGFGGVKAMAPPQRVRVQRYAGRKGGTFLPTPIIGV